MSITREVIGWALAALGAVFGIAAAYVKGGTFEALTAASASCTALATAFGWISKPASPPAAK